MYKLFLYICTVDAPRPLSSCSRPAHTLRCPRYAPLGFHVVRPASLRASMLSQHPQAVRTRRWRQANLERARAHQRHWRQIHRARRLVTEKVWRATHRVSIQRYTQRYRATHPDYRLTLAVKRLQKSYGLSFDAASRYLAERVAPCAICERQSVLVVDHHHATQHFRGRLCRPCNFMLGLANENPRTLQRALAYLEASRHA